MTRADLQPGQPGDPGRVPRGAARLAARARGRAVRAGAGAARPQPAAGVRLRRPGHAGRHGRGAQAARPPRRRGRSSTSPRCARCSTAAGLEYEVDPGLVRGLDYYTRTVFEFESGALGAQAALGGGGRYDGLVELLGGPPTPGVGLGGGHRADPDGAGREAGAGQRRRVRRGGQARAPRGRLPSRRASCATQGSGRDMEHTERSLKGQLKQADRLGVRHTVIMGDAVELKDMQTGEQREVGDVLGGACRVKPPRANAYRDAWAGDLRADRVGEEVRVAGWVHRRRDHGGLIFIDLRDRTGLLQLVFRPEEQPDAHAAAERLRGEHVLSARGELVRREEGTVNPNLPDRRGRAQRARAGGAGRVRDPALRDRRGRPGGRGAAAALPLPRPAPRAHARRDRAAPRGHAHDARAPGRGGLPRDRDARCSPARPPRARATSWCPPGCSRARGTRCPSRPSCSSSC